jgi:hypothetical protein
MNQTSHDHALSLGPCADFEFDLVEQSEGALDPASAAPLQQHLLHCARCRAYAAALVDLDVKLAGSLPRPALAVDFDERLAARIAGLRRSPDRAGALAAAEREHQQLLDALGRRVGWSAWSNAAALGSVAGGVLLALHEVGPRMLQAYGLVPAGFSAASTFAAVLGLAAMAGGLALSGRFGGGPLLRRA